MFFYVPTPMMVTRVVPVTYQLQQARQPAIAQLHTLDPTFQKVKRQWESQWVKNNAQPTLVAIFQIQSPIHIRARYSHRLTQLALIRSFMELPCDDYTGTRAPETMVFHGTGQQCTLGLNNNMNPCSNLHCSVCSIIKNGFSVCKASSSTGCRFGYGTYFTSCSSKAHDYNAKSEHGLGSGVRSMLMVRVAVGKTAVLTTGSYSGRSPPTGYDSITAKPGVTPNINYNEVIVFDDAASLPSFLVIYRY